MFEEKQDKLAMENTQQIQSEMLEKCQKKIKSLFSRLQIDFKYSKQSEEITEIP